MSLCLDCINTIVNITGIPLTICSYIHLLSYTEQSFPIRGEHNRRENGDDFFSPSDKTFSYRNIGNPGFTENCASHTHCWQSPSLQRIPELTDPYATISARLQTRACSAAHLSSVSFIFFRNQMLKLIRSDFSYWNHYCYPAAQGTSSYIERFWTGLPKKKEILFVQFLKRTKKENH